MKCLNFLLVALLSATISLGLTSCSQAEDEPSGSGLTINEKKSGKVYNAVCHHHNWSEELGGGSTTSFELQFNYDNDMTNFSLSWPIRRSAIKAGMNLMEIDDPEDVTFRSIYTIEMNADYEDFEGDVFVQSVSSKEITLKYSNFSFYKSLGRKTYTINGTMTYKIN